MLRIMMSVVIGLAMVVSAAAANKPEYRVLGTSRASTMEKELNAAVAAGYRFMRVSTGTNAIGGKELIVVTAKESEPVSRESCQYKVITASRTSTLQKEMQLAADDGYAYVDQAVFVSGIGGRALVVVMERTPSSVNLGSSYRVVAATKLSTVEAELNDLGAQGYLVVGLTTGITALGGEETVAILKKH